MSLPVFFELRPLVWICCKQRFPTHDPRTLPFKELAQFLRTEGRSVRAPIEFQTKPAVRFEESRAHITDEEFPISLGPFHPFTVFAPSDPVETNTMRGDEIEFLIEIGQSFLSIDS